MAVPIAARLDLDALVAAAAAEGWPVDLSAVVRHGGGWENVVLETADGWMLRFPRDGELAFDREVAILARLAGRLPVPVPVVAWTGTRTRCAVYRKLTGAAFDRVAYLAAPAAQRERLAASLARFLAAMHASLAPREVDELAIPPVAYQPILDLVAGGLDRIPAGRRRTVHALVERFAAGWAAGAVPGPAVVLHNDFHTGNMVFAAPVAELAGIWDFSCVQVGVPTYDLRYLDWAPRDLLDRLAEHYRALTGHPVDVAAAIVANRMENVFDALETGRMDLFDAALVSWARTDAGR